jgi:hypothetical protein
MAKLIMWEMLVSFSHLRCQGGRRWTEQQTCAVWRHRITRPMIAAATLPGSMRSIAAE